MLTGTTTHQLVLSELRSLNMDINRYRGAVDTVAEAEKEFPWEIETLAEIGDWDTRSRQVIDGLTVVIRLLEEKRDYLRSLLGCECPKCDPKGALNPDNQW